MSPAAHLGELLLAARRGGVAFEDAWPAATTTVVAGLEPDEIAGWLEAFNATRGAWVAAWERRPATRPERALLAVADDPDPEALPDRVCGRCGEELPPQGAGAPRKWCSEKCRRAASYERERTALAVAA